MEVSVNDDVQKAYNKYCEARGNAEKFLFPEIEFGKEIPTETVKMILEEQPKALSEEREAYAKYLTLLWKSQKIPNDEIEKALKELRLIDN